MSDIEIKCPDCGNTDVTAMSIVEDVPMVTPLTKREGNDLSYSGDRSDYCYGAVQTRRLMCTAPGGDGRTGCWCNFPLPEGISVLCD